MQECHDIFVKIEISAGMWFSTFNGLKNTFHTIFSAKRQRIACGRHIRCLVLSVWMSFRFFKEDRHAVLKKKSQVLLFRISRLFFCLFFFLNVGSGLILGSVGLRQYNFFFFFALVVQFREKPDVPFEDILNNWKLGSFVVAKLYWLIWPPARFKLYQNNDRFY